MTALGFPARRLTRGEITVTPRRPAATKERMMEQPVNVSPPPASFGALLRARRHRACLSQEQLAARAELSERTVRNLEAGRVQSPRAGTVRLLADALQLSEPERASWLEAAPDGQPGTAVHGGWRLELDLVYA